MARTNIQKSLTIIGLALIASTTLCCCLAKDVSQQMQQPQPLVQSQPQQRHSLASKFIPKARTARSLSDMFEKMKSKIFGNKKGQSSSSAAAASQSQQSAMQSLASVNSAQRQPWADLNSFNQQYNPYSPLASNNYQWPAGASGAQQQSFSGQPSLNSAGFMNSPSLPSGYPTITGQSPSMGLDASANQMPGASGPAGASQGGLLSSASHLIAQYLSPGSSSSSSVSSPSSPSSSSAPGQQNGQQNNILSPQQQSQYNEFASILDSMVAQTGVGSSQSAQQRPPNMNNQFSGQGQPNYQQNGMMGPVVGSSSPNGDQDMSGSSNVQSYATPQQASQKSSMVSLAEQLAPGAQFNKLVSFPFSLSNNDDPNKEGRYKLHIPFLNQHVKRSDQPQVAANNYAAAQQRMQQQQQQQQLYQQYMNQNMYNQQYMAAQPSQQQQQSQPGMMAQASQLTPTIVSPQSVQAASPQQVAASPSASASPSSSASVSSSSSSQPSSSSSASIVPSSSSSSASASASAPSASSAMSSVSAAQNPSPASSIISQSPQSSISVSSSVSSSSINSRPNWSVADTSSKLIPIQSSSQSSQAESGSQN